MSKFLHGFFSVVIWLCQCFSNYLSTFAKQTRLKFDQEFKARWSFCWGQKVLIESKYSMPWVHCAFDNVSILSLCYQTASLNNPWHWLAQILIADSCYFTALPFFPNKGMKKKLTNDIEPTLHSIIITAFEGWGVEGGLWRALAVEAVCSSMSQISTRAKVGSCPLVKMQCWSHHLFIIWCYLQVLSDVHRVQPLS